MRHPGKDTCTKRMTVRALSARLGVLTISLVALSFVFAASASATTFETVDHFGGVLTKPSGPFPEEVQLGNVADIAVNTSGAGGVAPGTIYAIAQSAGAETRVSRFGPTGDFEEAWSLEVGAKVLESPKRCGPATADPATPGVYTHCTAFSGGGAERIGIDVDQGTGNVYALIRHGVGGVLVSGLRIINPNGTKLIAEFGEADPNGTIAESPGKLHSTQTKGGIAVNDAGEVYVFDEDKTFHYRVMVFKPETPGDYEHYVYAGQSRDIAVGGPGGGPPGAREPMLDQAGNLYGGGDSDVVKYDPAQPSTPVCAFHLPASGIWSHTVNPVTGEVFYYSYKNRKIHQLNCNGEGKFVEVAAFGVAPERGELEAMTMDGGRKYSAGRSAGVLYAASVSASPITGSGGEPGAGPLGYILAPAEENPPQVVSESVANVTTTTATLRAQINPKGSPTDYAFQYITDAAYEANDPADRFAGASEAPIGGAELGSGQNPLSAAVALLGLEPDTAYRYRVVASSHCSSDEEKVCEAAGPAQLLRTHPVEAPGLADDRAWELVSPVQKNGGEVIPSAPDVASCGGECKPGLVGDRFPQQSSPDGEAVVYMGFPFSPGGGAVTFNQYVSRRTAGGWQTTTLSPVLTRRGGGKGYLGFDAALSKGLLYQAEPSLTPEAPSEYANIYAQSTATPPMLTALLSSAPPNRLRSGGKESLELAYAGASADLSRVFFEANDALTEETPFAPAAVDGGPAKYNLYEWSEEGLRLVNVAPGNATSTPGALYGRKAETQYEKPDLHNAISADGSRAFFTSGADGQIYVRIDRAETRAVSESKRTLPDPAEPAPAKFLSASPDGSRALFASSAQLTDDAVTGPIQQTFSFNATGGSFTLSFEGETTTATASGDRTTLATGAGDLVKESTSVTNVATATGAFAVGQSISGSGIAPHTKITAVNPTTLTLSAPATATASAAALTSGSKTISNLSAASGTLLVGEAVSGPGIPAGTTITALAPGTLTLSEGVTAASSGGPLSTALPYNASDGLIQAALESLPTIGAGNVVVSQGPNALTLTFAGALIANEELLSADGSGLSGTIAPQSVSHAGSALYEWHEGALTDLSIGREGRDGFQGIAGESDDLSHVYFVDTAVLDEAPNEHGDVAEKGEPNLYSWEAGSTSFIATLLAADNGNAQSGNGGAWTPSPAQRTAEASPNGRWLAFLSKGQPTGYDNTGACQYSPTQQKYVPSAPCPEAYLYDSATGELRCASCNPSGEAPLGPTNLRLISLGEGFLPQPRYLTDSGRLYFDTSDSLSTFDTNEGVEDVYQYEPEGVGTCKRAGGCVSLISAGHEAVDSNLLSVDATGKNVFFTSRDQLVLKDHDDLIDVYDAREGGGIASETETGRGECQGEACQPLYSPPNDPTPGSSTFQGAGNVDEKKAAKKHKKSHKKKHAKKKSKKHANKHKRAKHNRGGAK